MPSSSRDGSQLRRYEEATARALTALSLLVVPVYVGQALTASRGGPPATVMVVARAAIHVALGLDVVTRTVLAHHRGRFLWTHKLDLAAVFVPPLRAAREVVALRTILQRPGIVGFATFGSSVIVACSLVVYAAEHDHDDASIATIGDALWWAVVTTTTVGYGDEVPVTGQGRAMAVILMLLGIAVVSVVTAHIAASFVGDPRSAAEGRDDLTARLDRIEQGLAAIQAHLAAPDRAALGSDTTHPLHPETP